MIGHRGRHRASHPNKLAGLPPGTGDGRPATDPRETIQQQDSWLHMHQQRIRLLDALNPAEQLELLIYVFGEAPEAVRAGLRLVKPQLLQEIVR